MDPSADGRLRFWCELLAVLAIAVAITNVVALTIFQDRSSLVMAVEMLLYAGCSLAGRWLVPRGHQRLTVTLQVVALLAIGLSTIVTHRDMQPTTGLVVLLAGVVALLFADRRMLPWLLVLTWAVGLVATLVSLVPAAEELRPVAYETFLHVGSVTGVTALILWLLWQAHARQATFCWTCSATSGATS